MTARGEATQAWERALREAAATCGAAWLQDVVVLAECASTQDEALVRAAKLAKGVVVVAMHQTRGRGRLGRTWHAAPGLGVAMTLALPEASGERCARAECAGEASLRAGVAALRACESMVSMPSRVGVRWPNDVVERVGGRKCAGVLIERREGVLLIGVGINVEHDSADLAAEVRGSACSLRMLRSGASTIECACGLLRELHRALHEPLAGVLAAWDGADVLRGTRRTFVHDGARVTGVVEAIDPLNQIIVRTEAGVVVSLPALTTSLVHE